MGIFKKVQNIFQNKNEKTNLSEQEVQKEKNTIISNNEDKLSKSLKKTKESFFGKLAKKYLVKIALMKQIWMILKKF